MCPFLKIVAIGTVLLLSACASVLDERDALTVVPYEINSDRGIVVAATLNGKGPFSFALDTAATISVVFDDLSDELGLLPDDGKPVVIHGLVATGEFPLVGLDHLSVGTQEWHKPTLAAIPGTAARRAGVDGILGLDFLRRYAVGISTRDQVLRLYPPGLLQEDHYRGWTAVPLAYEEIGDTGAALYLLTVEIGAKSMPAVFDLGAGLNMMNWAAARSFGLDPDDLRGEEQVSGAIESVPVVARIRTREIQTGNVSWRNEQFMIAELQIFETLQRDTEPCAILGAGLFTQRDFIIDIRRDRLLIRTAARETDRGRAGDDASPVPGNP